MKKYTITGPGARIGIGTLIELTPAQYRPRAHLVTVESKGDDKKPWIVTVDQAFEFKRGEVIGLDEDPKARFGELAPGDNLKDAQKAQAAKAKADAKASA